MIVTTQASQILLLDCHPYGLNKALATNINRLHQESKVRSFACAAVSTKYVSGKTIGKSLLKTISI